MTPSGRRRKGLDFERKLVKLHQEQGVPAKRVPLSGAQEGYDGDLIIADKLKGEAKCRKEGTGFKMLESWLADNDLLFVKRDRQDPLVVMDFASYIRLVKALVMVTPDW